MTTSVFLKLLSKLASEHVRCSEAKGKPYHNMAFHRSAVLKRKLLDEHSRISETVSPGQGGHIQDPDLAASGKGLKDQMPIHHVGKFSGCKRKRSPSMTNPSSANRKRTFDPHISTVQNPSGHLSADRSIGYFRTGVVFNPALLDEVFAALGFGPSAHLETGDPLPSTTMADTSQHSVVSPTDGRLDRSVLNHT